MAHETFRHLDCASLYQNEREVGQAMKEAMKDFNISRNELFITSKVSLLFKECSFDEILSFLSLDRLLSFVDYSILELFKEFINMLYLIAIFIL